MVGPTPLTYEHVTFTRDFDRAVRLLPEPERDAFILTELRGLTVREAEALLLVPRSTVAWRAERAKVLIREEIA